MQLQRLKNLPWGPKNYVRNKEIIDNVISKLIQNGVVSLTGWGGVGKTALAQKIIVVEEEKYDYIIQNTLKIASVKRHTSLPQMDLLLLKQLLRSPGWTQFTETKISMVVLENCFLQSSQWEKAHCCLKMKLSKQRI